MQPGGISYNTYLNDQQTESDVAVLPGNPVHFDKIFASTALPDKGNKTDPKKEQQEFNDSNQSGDEEEDAEFQQQPDIFILIAPPDFTPLLHLSLGIDHVLYLKKLKKIRNQYEINSSEITDKISRSSPFTIGKRSRDYNAIKLFFEAKPGDQYFGHI